MDASGKSGLMAAFATRLSEPLRLELLLLLASDECLDLRVADHIDVRHEFVLRRESLRALGLLHAFIEEALLARGLDLIHTLHGLKSLDHEVSIIARWHVSLLLEL